MTDTPQPLYNPAIHHRRSIRLQGYDYSQAGAYFITICTHKRECLFGNVGAGSQPAQPASGLQTKDRAGLERAGLEPAPTQDIDQMVLNEYGKIVQHTWEDLPNHVGEIVLDAFVIMPNHVHGIIVMGGSGTCQLSEIVRQLKTFSARRINKKRGTHGLPVWQRNYYEHIIRDEDDLDRVREYIVNNPANWQSDENYLVAPSMAVTEDSSATGESRSSKGGRK